MGKGMQLNDYLIEKIKANLKWIRFKSKIVKLLQETTKKKIFNYDLGD